MTLMDLKFERGKYYGKSLSEVLILDYQYLQFMSSLSNRRASNMNAAIDDIPESWDKADALFDAEQCIIAGNYSTAEIVLGDYIDNNGPFI